MKSSKINWQKQKIQQICLAIEYPNRIRYFSPCIINQLNKMLKINNWDSQDSKTEVSIQCWLTLWDSSSFWHVVWSRSNDFLSCCIWSKHMHWYVLYYSFIPCMILSSYIFCFCSNCIFNLFSLYFFPRVITCRLSQSLPLCFVFLLPFLSNVLMYLVLFCTFCCPLTRFVIFIGFIPTASTMEECIMCITRREKDKM